MITSKNLKLFIDEFEQKFGGWLYSSRTFKMLGSDISTPHLKITSGKKKYSDWDFKCIVKDNTPFTVVKELFDFIYNHQSLESVGNFMTDSKAYKELGRYKNHTTTLQLMGMIKDQDFAPFFDISIFNVNNKYIQKLFSDRDNKDFLSWSLITCWRKIKNENFIGVNGYAWINTIFVLPQYVDRDDKKALLANPEKFFQKQLSDTKYKHPKELLIK